MNHQQRVAPSNFFILEDDDVENRIVFLEEMGKLKKTQSKNLSFYEILSDAVYARTGKRFLLSNIQGLLPKIDADYQKLLDFAITRSDVSDQVMQWWRHTWPYNKACAFRFEHFEWLEKKKREEMKKKEEEEELRNRSARRMLSAQRRSQRNQTPRIQRNRPSTPSITLAVPGGAQARASAPKRAATQLAQSAGTPQTHHLPPRIQNGPPPQSIPAAPKRPANARNRKNPSQMSQGSASQSVVGFPQTPLFPQIMQNGMTPPATAAALGNSRTLGAGPVQNGPSRVDVAVREVVQLANMVNNFHPNSAGLFERIMKDAVLKFFSENAKGSSGNL